MDSVQAACEKLSRVEKLPPEQQASVLAAPGAVSGLAYNGEGEAVERIQRSMTDWRSRAARENPSSGLGR